jgi:hypothetical protein
MRCQLVVPFVVLVEKPRKDDTTAHPTRQQFFIQNQMRRRRLVTRAKLRATLRLTHYRKYWADKKGECPLCRWGSRLAARMLSGWRTQNHELNLSG